jgi:hypothetical protein
MTPQDLDMDFYVRNANDIKTLVINQLLVDKVITEEQAETYQTNWNIIVVKQGWFKQWLKKYRGDNIKPNDYIYKYINFEPNG